MPKHSLEVSIRFHTARHHSCKESRRYYVLMLHVATFQATTEEFADGETVCQDTSLLLQVAFTAN